MAVTTVATGNQVQQWSSKFYKEYVRDSLFAPYMGSGINSIIQVKTELTKKAGNTVSFPLVTRLTNDGITGDNTLEGNEEPLDNYNHDITVDQVRNAVVIGKMEKRSTVINMPVAAKDALRMWIMEDLRDDKIGRAHV